MSIFYPGDYNGFIDSLNVRILLIQEMSMFHEFKRIYQGFQIQEISGVLWIHEMSCFNGLQEMSGLNGFRACKVFFY